MKIRLRNADNHSKELIFMSVFFPTRNLHNLASLFSAVKACFLGTLILPGRDGTVTQKQHF